MKNDISHMLEKAGFCGGAAVLCGIPFFGLMQSSWQIPYTNTTIPLEILTFSLGTANSFVADGVHQFFNQVVPLGKKTADKASLLTNAAVAGASFYALLHLGGMNVPRQVGLLSSFCIGAGAEVIGSGTYEYLQNNISF